MRFTNLTLTCRQSTETIDLCAQVNFFHGKISAGKSTIANLLDFCLGGELVKTPAVQQELISVALSGEFADKQVLLERQKGNNQVQVSWSEGDKAETLLVPVNAGDSPVMPPNIYNLSDLLFHLLGMRPIKMRKNQRDPEAEMIRLSFRDIMKFCYLQQKKLDSSFFDLTAPILQSHSRMAMRFFVGYYSAALSDLEQRLAQLQSERKRKTNSIEEISSFLDEQGIKSGPEIDKVVTKLEIEIRDIEKRRFKIRSEFGNSTHFVDELRDNLRAFSARLDAEKTALIDIRERADEQKSLRAELITTRMKLARAHAASSVLSGVSFQICPCCGSSIKRTDTQDGCTLCGQDTQETIASHSSKESTDLDLKFRISELDDSLKRHQRELSRQEKRVAQLASEKAELDARLRQELSQYDSDYLAASREFERSLASLQERVRALREQQRLPAKVYSLQQECDTLRVKELQVQREINQEREQLVNADVILTELENEYLSLLRTVKYPGMGPQDTVSINRSTFIPSILPDGDEARAFTFDDAGSAGKSTLLNVCFGLALHLIGSRRKLPIPKFLMIDSPMKNISADVNKGMFVSFFDILYDLAAVDLKDTQFLIIENDFIKTDRTDLVLAERFMAQDDPDNPPLISYYRGH